MKLVVRIGDSWWGKLRYGVREGLRSTHSKDRIILEIEG